MVCLCINCRFDLDFGFFEIALEKITFGIALAMVLTTVSGRDGSISNILGRCAVREGIRTWEKVCFMSRGNLTEGATSFVRGTVSGRGSDTVSPISELLVQALLLWRVWLRSNASLDVCRGEDVESCPQH